MRPSGTLTVTCSADVVYSTNDKARILAAPLRLPQPVNLNGFVNAVVCCIGRHAFTCGRVVMFESEPKSRQEAHIHNHLKQALRLLALTRGIEVVSVNEVGIEALNDFESMSELPAGWASVIDARAIERFRRVALRAGVSFGNVVLPFDPLRSKRRTDFYELLRAAVEKRLHWPNYETVRDKSNGLPIWLKAMA